MQVTRSTKPAANRESGFVLIAVLFLVALILIGLAVAAPQVAKSIQRDKELELIHRGNQYRRAIKLYYKKFGAYPSTIDQLMNTNQVRFLRKRYTDPMTGKDDWKLVYFGQAHIKPMGLFGQTLATGSMVNAVGGGVGSPIGSSTDGSGSAFGSTTGNSSSSGSSFGTSSGSSFGSSGSSFGSSGSSFGAGSGSSFGAGSGGSFGSSGSSGSGFGSSDGSSTGSGFGSTNGTTAGGTTATGAAGAGTTGAFGTSGSTGSTLGGGPIVGVVIPDTRASIKEYKKQKHYNEWEFVYDPIEEQMLAGMGAGQQNLNGATPIGGSGAGSGFSNPAGGGLLMNGGQSGTSGAGGLGGTSGGGTTPLQPQQ